MPTILLDAKLWRTLALAALALGVLFWLHSWGNERYQAGYNARQVELDNAAKAAQKRIDETKKEAEKNALQLEKDLEASRRRSEALAARIRDASFECANLGPSFVELFNEANTGTGVRARPTD